MEPSDSIGASAIFKLEGALVSKINKDASTKLQCINTFKLFIINISWFVFDLLYRELIEKQKRMTRDQNQMPVTCLEPIHLMCHVLLTVSKILFTLLSHF